MHFSNSQGSKDGQKLDFTPKMRVIFEHELRKNLAFSPLLCTKYLKIESKSAKNDTFFVQ